MGSLVNSVFLLALCFSVIIDAIQRFITPEELENLDLMLIVGGVGLLINLIGLLIFGLQGIDHGHSHGPKDENQKVSENNELDINVIEIEEKQSSKKDKKIRSTKNMNIHGVFLHVLSDALGSIAVIISGLLIKFVPPKDDATVTWKLYIDPILSLVITFLIITSAIPLLKASSLILLQTVPNQFDIEDLKRLVSKVPGVAGIHHFHVWSLNSEKLVATAHLCVRKNENTTVLEDVKKILHKQDIHSTTLQLEYDPSDDDKKYDFCDGIDCDTKQCCQQPPKERV